jgi:hypothetical protein
VGGGGAGNRPSRALRLQRLKVSDREDPFAAIIRCTADPAKADKRTRSKWSRVMRYAAAYKSVSEPLDQFIQRKGGINACAARPHGAPAGSLRATRGNQPLPPPQFRYGPEPALLISLVTSS